jgi:hypothetical protein
LAVARMKAWMDTRLDGLDSAGDPDRRHSHR